MAIPQISDEELAALQWSTLAYYIHEVNPLNGLVADKSEPGSPASIAASGMALSTVPVVVERGLRSREEMAERVLVMLRFYRKSPQGPEPDATGYKGFYYHFLDFQTGRRVWNCEISTIDTTLLLAGMLAVAAYFQSDSPVEVEIRRLVDYLYGRVDWDWALHGGPCVSHGWTPEGGFLPYRWCGYDEALLLYVLGLGSPTHPLPIEAYQAWTANFEWKAIYDVEMLYAGPLFIHQFSQIWLDLRETVDAPMKERGTNYFENSRLATIAQREYAIRNPMEFVGYAEDCWGFTACNGPGWFNRKVNGIDRQFFDYTARGIPFGPDDGTVAPWAVLASLPFAPEIVLPTVRHFEQSDLGMTEAYGFRPTFNRTFALEASEATWVSPYWIGIDQGPIVLMIENYRTGLLWDLMRRSPYVVQGLRRAGFRGGWL